MIIQLAFLIFATFSIAAPAPQESATPTIWPPVGFALHPNGDTTKCLDVQGANFADGTIVQIYDCNQTPAQQWLVNRDQTQVQVYNTTFCLDAGENWGNGVGMKIWTCYPGLTQQTWWYTADNRIALMNQGQCLDLTNGNLANTNQIQTWQCATGNTNQIWTEGVRPL